MKRIVQAMLLVAVAAAAGPARTGPRASGAMGQGVYVWQREWGATVRESVGQHAGAFESVIVLGAEIAWKPDGPGVAHPAVDWNSLKTCGRPVGIAVRIGTPPASGDAEAVVLRACAEALSAARSAGVEPAELQLDFDCATSKLGTYRQWVRAARIASAPTPLTITALPAWLSSAEFAPLARDTDGFVLQVHALDRPRMDDPEARLCDDQRAAAWVERAARVGGGVPFRVALPTYGYLVVYGQKGELRGVIAETEAPTLEAAWKVRELRADPCAMARLVRTWTNDRPALMRGLLWYRLPVPGNRLNWSWPTLARVMRGETPSARLAVHIRTPEPGLAEVCLANEGDADARLPSAVLLHWTRAMLLATDGLGGMEPEQDDPQRQRFVRPQRLALERIGAGNERAIGWIRLSRDTEVTGDVVP